MTIRLLPDLLKRPEPLHPTAQARMRRAMGMPPQPPQSTPRAPNPAHPRTPEQDHFASWLRHQCGWR